MELNCGNTLTMASIYNKPTTITDITDSMGNIIVDPNIPDSVTPLDVDLLRYKPNLPPIDYTNLDFSSIKLQLLNLLKANTAKLGYSVRDFADANTAGMFLNLMAYMGQMMSYHVDSMVNELFLDTAQSNYSAHRLLSMFKYKPTRPRQGVILLKVIRRRSTAATIALRTIEDSSDIVFSSSLSRRKITIGGENFEIFPIKSSEGIIEPDFLGDFVIPSYKELSMYDPDAELLEQDINTYACFALTGATKIEDFRSNGKPNQSIRLNSSPVLNSDIIVQVENTDIHMPDKIVYNTWGELSYITLSGFRTSTNVGITKNLEFPYLIAPFKLSPEMYSKKKNGALDVGTLLQIDYNQVASIANFRDFINLNVPYRVGVVSSLTSQYSSDDEYVDLLIYHPSYVYSRPADNGYTGITSSLVTTVKDSYNSDVPWRAGDILYLLDFKQVRASYNSQTAVYQPQIISDTQIQLADPLLYPDIKFLKDNPQFKTAVGKVVSDNTIAFGISADINTEYEAENVYEVTWDSSFKSTVRFGDGKFGNIPEAGAAIKVIYRVNDSISSGYVVKPGESLQVIKVGNVEISLNNDSSSSPSTEGETLTESKELVSRFFATQDRAVSSDDYLTLAKRYNPLYKISSSLVKADADGSIVRLHCLNFLRNDKSIQNLTTTEKYQLRNWLNQYKCLGVDIEVADGSLRKLDIRIDARVKAGYLTGQVRNELISESTEFFNPENTEMGRGLNSVDFIKAISSVSGVKSLDIYLGGLATILLPDGTEVTTGVKTYKNLKDIPNYKDSINEFPKLVSEYEVILGAEDAIKPHELLILDTLTVNVLT